MSYSIRNGKYLYEQHYEGRKKVHNYGGIVKGDYIVEPYPDGIESMIEYELKQAYEHSRKAEFLILGKNPRTYSFDQKNFEEWMKRQRTPVVSSDKSQDVQEEIVIVDAQRRPIGRAKVVEIVPGIDRPVIGGSAILLPSSIPRGNDLYTKLTDSFIRNRSRLLAMTLKESYGIVIDPNHMPTILRVVKKEIGGA